MTKPAPGSSLAQTRGPTAPREQHQHQHLHQHRNNNHGSRHLHHAHLHARYQQHGGGKDHHARSHEKNLSSRIPILERHVTAVVQTISVIQYIDETGSIIDVKTVIPEQTAPRATSASDLTLDPSFLNTILPTLSVPSVPSGDGYPPATDSSGEVGPSTATSPPSSLPSSGALTSAPSSYTSLSGSFNSTCKSLSPSFFAIFGFARLRGH